MDELSAVFYWYYLRASYTTLQTGGVCVSVRTPSWKLLAGNQYNLVGMCPIVNARGDIWPWPLTLRDIFVFFHLAYIFGVKLHFHNILVTFEFQGHVSKPRQQTNGRAQFVIPSETVFLSLNFVIFTCIGFNPPSWLPVGYVTCRCM